ncbi:hypothetical protein RQP46_002805 [Phenoliferia psychrophenolica]
MEKRIQRELKDAAKDTESTIAIRTVGDSLVHLVGSFMGPAGTPYEGGRFEVDIHVPAGYPFNPLLCKMITKVYHPNVSSANGAICLSTLGSEWSPVFTLRTVLLSLRSLLADPQPLDPQDGEVAKVFLSDPAAASQTAKFWTEVYAKPEGSTSTDSSAGPPQSFELERETRLAGLEKEHVQRFTQMGFEPPAVISTLARLNYRGAKASTISDDEVLQGLLG